MKEQVLIYEIKGSVDSQSNAKTLLSADKSLFYWSDKRFANVYAGDFVFVINPKAGIAYFTRLVKKNIPSTYNPAKKTSFFKHNRNSYEIKDPQKKFTTFVCLEILETRLLPKDWSWEITLGHTEQMYLWSTGIQEPEKRLSKVRDLKNVFTEGNSYKILLEVEKLLIEISSDRKVWFVIQGKSYNENWGKLFLWAPKQNEEGRKMFYWDNVRKVKKGDIIFNYSDGLKAISIATSDAFSAPNPDTVSGWVKEGYSVNIELKELNHVVSINEFRKHRKELVDLLQEVANKPFQADGSANQGYLYEFTAKAGKYIRDIMYKQRFGNVTIDNFFDKVNLKLNNSSMPKTIQLSPDKVIQHMHTYIESLGFQYEQDEIANFYLALKTKPFVILAGISGTGKSQLPRKFAAALGMDKSQVIQVPVRPDWTDGSDLLGYTSLDGNFVPKDLTLAITEAKNNPDKPYFFILDEMNLARVENYFSDFLSVIETREWDENKIIRTAPILRKESLQKATDANMYKDYEWPQNLYLIGTVNMDETTHTFSRKVLDRANSIEMNDVDLQWNTKTRQTVAPLKSVTNDLLVAEYIEAIDLSEKEKSSLDDQLKNLIQINKILETAGLHFAYRVRDEIIFYLTLNKKYKLMDEKVAMDFQIVQKILPRIHGSSERVQSILVELFNYLEDSDFKSIGFEYEQYKEKINKMDFIYKRSSAKIIFMLKRFEDDRFTSFWL